MPDFIPSAVEENVGANEVMFHAQKIIDAFSKALSDNNCLTQIPIGIYAETSEGINQMEDALIAMGDAANPVIDRPYPTRAVDVKDQSSGVQVEDEVRDVLNDITNAIRKVAGEECIDCGWDDFPSLNMDDLWGQVMGDLEDMISKFEAMLDQFKGLGKALDPGICHLTYMLSFVCIPDLIKLLALLLALLIKIMSGINLSGFSLQGFINAIIGAIIGALLDWVSSIINWAITPIGCIIDSLSLVIDQLPTQNNLRAALTQEQLTLIGLQEQRGPEQLAPPTNGVVGENREGAIIVPADSYIDKFGKDLNVASNDIHDIRNENAAQTTELAASFTLLKDKASEGLEAVLGTWADLESLTLFMSCEGDRNGPGLKDQIQNVVQLVQLINLVTAVISQKSFNLALDELCTVKKSGTPNAPDIQTQSGPFSADEIADVIEAAFGGVATIVGSAAGDIGIILQDNSTPAPNKLDLFTCSLNDFVKDNHLDEVIQNGIVLAEEALIGSGEDPRTNLRPRTTVDEADISDNTQVLLYGQSGNNFNSDIMNIINEVISFNTDRPDIDTTLVGVDNKLNPNTLPDQEVDDTGAGTTILQTGSLLSTSGTISSGLKGTATSKPLSLKCGTIENLQQSLSFINENK